MTQTVFRAYCGLNGPHGDDGRETEREAIVVELCQKWFPNGVTTYDAVGLWKGNNQERTIVVEVITDCANRDHDLMRRLAAEYKMLANQEAVMITRQEIEADFV
jgi:hypothetical protein